MAGVTFQGASRIYSPGHAPAVDHLNLEISDGEFLVLVGPSGCGKSTTLRMLAGLEPIDDGAVFIGDRDVTMMPPKDRDIAMVFQSYALYPHMTVRRNIEFPLRNRKVPKAEIGPAVDEMLAPLGWAPEDDKPFQAHLTLGRVKHSNQLIQLPWGERLAPRPVPVDAIYLIQSQLRPDGPVYTIRHKAPLAKPAAPQPQ